MIPSQSVIDQCVRIAADLYPSVDWESLNVTIMRSEDYIGEDILALTEWDADGLCCITIMDRVQYETELRETLAHELAHFIMGELHTETHNARPHGKKWFKVFCRLQRELVWRVYFPEEWEN